MEGGRKGEEGREGGRKGKRKGGRNDYTLWGPSVHALIACRGAGACARSSQLVQLLLCPCHSMVVGAIAIWSLSWAVQRGCGRLLLLPGLVLWALIVVVGIHIRMQMLVVVGMHVHVRVVVIVDVDVGEGLVVVLHICMLGWLVVIVGGCVICCALIMVICGCGLLLVVVGGDRYGQLSLFVVVHWW